MEFIPLHRVSLSSAEVFVVGMHFLSVNQHWSTTSVISSILTSARMRPPTKELFLIIPMHAMSTEFFPGR